MHLDWLDELVTVVNNNNNKSCVKKVAAWVIHIMEGVVMSGWCTHNSEFVWFLAFGIGKPDGCAQEYKSRS